MEKPDYVEQQITNYEILEKISTLELMEELTRRTQIKGNFDDFIHVDKKNYFYSSVDGKGWIIILEQN